MLSKKEAEERAGQLSKDGKLIEAGWVLLMLVGAPDNLSPGQLDMVRYSFFRGAKHMLTLLERAQQSLHGDEVINRMADDLRAEFKAFTDETLQKYRNKPNDLQKH